MLENRKGGLTYNQQLQMKRGKGKLKETIDWKLSTIQKVTACQLQQPATTRNEHRTMKM